MPSKQITQLREDIHQFIKDEDFEAAMNALRDGLSANHTVRQNRSDGQRGVEYIERPNHTTRLTAANLCWSMDSVNRPPGQRLQSTITVLKSSLRPKSCPDSAKQAWI